MKMDSQSNFDKKGYDKELSKILDLPNSKNKFTIAINTFNFQQTVPTRLNIIVL